ERTQQRILEGITFARGLAGRRRFHQAEEAALRLAGFLDALEGVERTMIAGELRRGLEIVDGIALVSVTRGDTARVAQRIRSTSGLTWYEGDDRVVRGRFGDGLAVDVCLTNAAHAGIALLHMTGSSAHIDALAHVAAERGLELTSDGLRDDGSVLHTPDEPAVYDALGLQVVPPELRESGEEVVLARDHALPRLLELDDL